MDYKKTNAPDTTITRDFTDIEKDTQNIYKSLVAVGKRSKQIQKEIKEELNQKLQEFALSYTDNLEEIFENREQIEISKFYERLPKPVLIAMQELLEDKIYMRDPKQEDDQ